MEPRRIEIHEGPDERGRYMYSLFWYADYHPGHPIGENRWGERGQVFFGNPDVHGMAVEHQRDNRKERREGK